MEDFKCKIKEKIGQAAALLIPEGAKVGLGTGTTASYFIEALGKRCQEENLHILAVASSENSLQLARACQIPTTDVSSLSFLDITVDGADEIDPQKRMIKGLGGALLREKILASMSQEMIVIVDQSKLVPSLGKGVLPVEIIPFAFLATQKKIEELGFPTKWREQADGSFFITDNHNYILDLSLKHFQGSFEDLHKTLKLIPGVVETGLFFSLAGRVIVGYDDGNINILT